MSNPEGKRSWSDVSVQHRLREVERLTLLGWTKPMIAAELEVSERQVGYDRAALREEYKEERLADQDEARDREHRRLLVLYAEAVNQFNKSKMRTVKCSCVTENGAWPTCTRCQGQGVVEVEGVGDPAFLTVARGIVHDIRELFSLNLPKRLEVKKLSINLQQLIEESERQAQGRKEIDDILAEEIAKIPSLPPAKQAQTKPTSNGHLQNGLHELPPSTNGAE
jgi:hypothetical protein